MKVETKGHTTTIKDTKNDLADFIEKVSGEYESLPKNNLIIDLSAYDVVQTDEIDAFLPLAKMQKKAKKSLVIVADTDYNACHKQLVVVPSMLEANDMIDMDEIERDLGF